MHIVYNKQTCICDIGQNGVIEYAQTHTNAHMVLGRTTLKDVKRFWNGSANFTRDHFTGEHL